MKPVSILLFFASAASTALAAVAQQEASADVASAATKNLYVRPHGEIKCRTTDPKHNMATELHVTRRWNIPYLDEPDKICDPRPGPDGCGRISCSWNSGIHICQRNLTQPVPFMCYEAADWARDIVKKCGNNDMVIGAAYDTEHDLSVEIFFSEC
ncbi:hypothetical protein B0T16DRAFT_487593 [Cercophora newfieldiana]|uniref:Uncharacterized protein n=1 Tax=Cercophora newfieldiana TaxID=92897 RepID=A0AA39YPD5_9PEZI|nr:hypothetical protein B0T16DRAFT_487593 [Cercophora newfieldiana]